jgi:DNA topoisomerase IA
LNSFLKHLENIKYPIKKQKQKELWDIEGIIKNKSNQSFKFDLRPISKHGNELGKKGSIKTKANKMVFEAKDQWIIVDIEELHTYLKENKLQKVYLQDLLSKLEWNIILPK